MDSSPLIIVSNRGPAQFERGEDGERTVRRGGGGLVTALSGLVSHRDALWIASAMTDEDVAVSEERGGPVEIEIDGIDYRLLFVESDPDAYDRFYNVIANPILWFIQHYLWDLSNAPDIRQEELDAWDFGYQEVNRDIANAVLGQIEEPRAPAGDAPRLPPLHGAGDDPRRAPRRLPPPLRPHPLVTTGQLADPAGPDPRGDLPGDARQRHHRLPHPRLLHQLHPLLRRTARGSTSTTRRCVVRHAGGQTLCRAYPLGIDAERLRGPRSSPEVAEAEREVLERRRKHLIIRVDRADLSKNVLRGFTAFDTFLTQHPEFREQVTFIAHLQPSRQDVPEYAEYLERIEALVAVVNHRHGTTDWMPIDLKIYENFHEAVARYKHFDLLMVNSIFDGMNLVAKEAPAVNTRDGVLMLSENTGSHEELADCAISVNPFDIQEQADAIYRALTMDPEERRVRAQHLKEIIFSRNPGDWVDDQLADIAELRETVA